MIASTSNDLTLDTGSFEYINIKDKDISYNFGGGANAGTNYTGKPEEKNNTWSVNANYSFSQKRQTNFATIGEGTIIVRDGDGDLSGLNRDVTKAQYGTVDIGLEGGFTVDSSTVAFVTSPIKTIAETYAALEKGYEDAAKTSEEIYEKSVVLYERTTNYIGEKGFHTNGEVILIELQYKEAFAYFIPGTDEVQNGIRIIRASGPDGGIIGITDYDYDGTQRNSYRFGDLDEITHYTQENYIIVDGQRVKSHELIYRDDLRLVNNYDSTGNGIYRSAKYQYSDGTYVLQYVDDWMVGVTGEVIKDIKQFDKIYADIIMNDKRLARGLLGDTSDRYNPNNYVANSGCLLTSAAIVDDFYGGAYGDPKKMDALADRRGLYYDKYTANVAFPSVANELGYTPKELNQGGIDAFRSQINLDLQKNIPTIIYFSEFKDDSHFAVIGGTRFYDNSGIEDSHKQRNNDYLVRDQGSIDITRSLLNAETLSNKRGQVKKIYYMYKDQKTK